MATHSRARGLRDGMGKVVLFSAHLVPHRRGCAV